MTYRNSQFTLYVPVEYRRADPAFGEIREDLAVLPHVSQEFGARLKLISRPNASARTAFPVEIENLTAKPLDGTLTFFAPPDSASSSSAKQIGEMPLHLEMGEDKRVAFDAIPSQMNFIGGGSFIQTLWRDEGLRFGLSESIHHMDYKHIRPRYLNKADQLGVRLIDAVLPDHLKVGYINGTGDNVANALSQLGADVAFISPDALETEDLSGYDSIIIGIRAYEVRPDLIANNQRLLDYVNNGGTLIVQYQQYVYPQKNLAPYPVKIRSPHDRVTDETAKITILDPAHPIFNYPNKITDRDFEGWVQERGLYFLSEWDDHFKPLMECADPGEPQQRGGMLIARIGKGNYIYTGYAFFRQLPAGVEGAIRLFVNMISLGKAEK
ncbi:hypothetical protein HYR69_09385 [Candidatus Sumerlaeota bacterium]|nr:hypothetical protein [Candidatus Sumerlaeota bacterium]